MEGKPTADALIDRRASDVGEQHVAGELDTLEFQPQVARQRVGQGGLAHTGGIVQQQMAFGQQAGHGLADLVFLAEDDVRDLIDGLMDASQWPLIDLGWEREIEYVGHEHSGELSRASNEVFGRPR